jgi:D-sedoheptulose 7-phosphate isomerase
MASVSAAPYRLEASLTAETVSAWLKQMTQVLVDLPVDAVTAAAQVLASAYDADRTIYVLGNGGSASTATHLACDFSKATRDPEARPVRCVSLSDNMALITAWSNDTAFERAFEEQVRNLVRAEDALIVISASGNSPNVLRAIDVARDVGAKTVGLLGLGGGKAAAMVDVAVVVPSDDYGWTESAHLVLEHVLTYALRDHVRQGSGRA